MTAADWLKFFILLAVPLSLMFWMHCDSKKYRKEFITFSFKGEKVGSLDNVLDLEKLVFQVQNMDLEKYHKERILKTIDFEKYMIESELIKKLGQKVYEDLRKEKEAKNESNI